MSIQEGAAGSVRAQIAEVLSTNEYVVHRDRERPFSFAGVCLATESIVTMANERISACVYRTAAGKFVATFDRERALVRPSEMIRPMVDQVDPSDTPEKYRAIHKANVFETLDEALAWYRPGRLTDAIRKKLGLDDPIRID